MSIIYANKRFKRILLFGCAVIPPLRLKSICVRTQIAKTEYLPAEYIPPTFWLVPPPPFPQVHRGGCYREKFFIFFWIHYQLVLIILRFLFFFWFSLVISQKSGLRIFWILYSLFLIIKFLEYFSRVNINSYLFRLVSALSIICFDSSTLYLFDSSACYKQTSMLIWVCFMLILAILRLSDVFSFVLGVVYRLGLK